MSHSAAFKVLVAIHAADFTSRHLSHIANLASQAGQGIGSINTKLKLMGGLAALMVGGATVGAMVKLTEHSVKAATELENVERRLKSIGGINSSVFKDISSKGWALGNAFPYSTQADRLQVFGDLHTVFGDAKLAKSAWSPGLRFRGNMLSINPEGGEQDFFAAFKAAELSTAGKNGHIASPVAFMKRLELFSNVYAGTMGRVKPNDLYAFMKQAKYSRFDLTDQALYKAAAMMYETGGSQTGTAYQALARVAGGRLGNSSSGATYAREWERMGLLSHITERSKQGNPKRFDVVGAGLLYSDPNQWAEKIFMPAMKSKGFTLDHKDKFLAQLVRMFGNQSAGQGIYTMLQQRGVIAKDADIMAKSKVQPYGDSYAGAFQSLRDSFTDLFAVMGQQLQPVIVPAVKALTDGIRKLTEVFRKNPELTKVVVGLGLLVGVAISAAGALLVLTPLVGGMAPILGQIAIVGGVAAIALTTFIANIWLFKINLDNACKGFSQLIRVFQQLGGVIATTFNGLLANLHLPQLQVAQPYGHQTSKKSIVVHQNFHGIDKPNNFSKLMKEGLHEAIINPRSAFGMTSTHHNKQAFGHGY